MGKRFTVDAVFRGINKISKPARSMGRSISKFVRKSNRQIAKLGRRFKKLGSIMGKAIIGGAGVAVIAVGAAVVKTAELGDEAAKTGRRLGLTAEALQELRFAADRQGVSAGLLNSSFTALQKRVGELKSGTGSLFAFLKKTGDKAFIRQLKLAKSTEEAFELITKRTNEIKDPMKKAAFAAAAFSRSGIDMIKFMEAGTDGIAKLRGEARKYGAVISNEAAARSELFIDSLTNLKSSLTGVGKTFSTKLMPFVTRTMQRFADFWAVNKKGIGIGMDRFINGIVAAFRFLKPIVVSLFKSFKTLFSALFEAVGSLLPEFTAETGDMKKGVNSLASGLKFLADIGVKAFKFITSIAPFLKPFIATLLIYKGILIAVALATGLWTKAIAIQKAVMAASPIGLIVIGIAALIAIIVLLVQNWDTVVSAFKSGIESIWNWFSGLLDNPFFTAIATIFLPFITIPALIVKHWEPIKEFFSGVFDSIMTGFGKVGVFMDGIIDKINSIPGVASAIKFFTGKEEVPKIEPTKLEIVKPKIPEFGKDVLKTAIRADLKLIPKIEREKTETARPVTPQERLSRSIEQNTDRSIKETISENNSVLTIKDQTGRAELEQKKGGKQITLDSSGGLAA